MQNLYCKGTVHTENKEKLVCWKTVLVTKRKQNKQITTNRSTYWCLNKHTHTHSCSGTDYSLRWFGTAVWFCSTTESHHFFISKLVTKRTIYLQISKCVTISCKCVCVWVCCVNSEHLLYNQICTKIVNSSSSVKRKSTQLRTLKSRAFKSVSNLAKHAVLSHFTFPPFGYHLFCYLLFFFFFFLSHNFLTFMHYILLGFFSNTPPCKYK